MGTTANFIKLRGNKTGQAGAKKMVAIQKEQLSKKPTSTKPTAAASEANYKIRLNEKLTVAKINKILDAIDANNGYCPCQMQSEDTKCHCKDFLENKGFGEPCICKIYVKQKVS